MIQTTSLARLNEAAREALEHSASRQEEAPGLVEGPLGHLAGEPLDERLYSAAVWEEFLTSSERRRGRVSSKHSRAKGSEGRRDQPRGDAMKRFLICTVRSDGRPEIYAETDLPSEAERFEELGYPVLGTSERCSVVA